MSEQAAAQESGVLLVGAAGLQIFDALDRSVAFVAAEQSKHSAHLAFLDSEAAAFVSQ